MPGLSAHDFGDAVRFGASSAAEDETKLSSVFLRLDLYRAYLEGYLDACGHALTENEIDVLPLGARIITIELAARFLKDYLDGDLYFKIDRPSQNLDRCRAQLQRSGGFFPAGKSGICFAGDLVDVVADLMDFSAQRFQLCGRSVFEIISVQQPAQVRGSCQTAGFGVRDQLLGFIGAQPQTDFVWFFVQPFSFLPPKGGILGAGFSLQVPF